MADKTNGIKKTNGEEIKQGEIENELSLSIQRGDLTDPKSLGLTGLYKSFLEKFSQGESIPEFLKDEAKFKDKVLELIWTKKTLAALEEAVKYGVPLKRFHSYHLYIPFEMVDEKAKLLSGSSNAKNPVDFLRGIGRLSGVESIEDSYVLDLPKTSINDPCLTVVSGNRWQVMVLNGANIGIKHSRLIQDNPVRCALACAKRNDDKAVILVNTIDLDLKKAAGPLKVLRALVSGYNTNLDILDLSYKKKAKRILDELPKDEVIYETASEIFLNILSGWRKICRRSNGDLEFPGSIYIIFGRKEEELIASAAYWELRYLTIVKWHQLGVEVKLARRALAEAKAKKKREAIIEKKLDKQLNELIQEQSRTVITNIRREDFERFYRRMRTFVVRKFEEAIPNSKVIGQGDTYVKFGDHVVLFHMPNHGRVTDELLMDFTNYYASAALRESMPGTVIVCHPYSLNFRATVREVDAKGKRGSSQVLVAPIAVDADFLRESLKDVTYSPHPLSKAVFSGQFHTGVLRINCANNLINPDDSSIESLIKFANSKNRKPGAKYIWVMTATDQHWGGRSKEFIQDSQNGKYLGMCEAAIEIMRRSGVCNEQIPIHIFNSNDDPTQGNHFQTQQQPHPHELPYHEIEKFWSVKMKEAENASSEKLLIILDELRWRDLYQFRVRGTDWTQSQFIEVVRRHIKPNIDFFSGVVSRATSAGLIVKGVSVFSDVPHDGRDIGVINYGTGNHLAATVNKEFTEGILYAMLLREMLHAMPQWNEKEELLERFVKAPLYSNQSYGLGTIQVPGGYEWGFAFKDSPPKLSSWGDPLLSAVRNDEARGNYSRIFEGRVTLKTFGDKHFFASVSTESAFYHMCASGTATDLYGERGFPPNNTGVSFIGLPAEGPDSGPILIRTLRFDQMENYFKKPYQFDWSAFLPNPA